LKALSYSGGSGRSFGSKGSSQKKDRKRKQEFHKHKVKFTEEDHLDFEHLKTRVTVALDKLGHQEFSVESGGYTFQDWMKSLNLLLDDFEEKADPKNLPKDYYDSRLKLTADLLEPSETADIDWEIKNLEGEIDSVKAHMFELSKKVGEKREAKREIESKIDRLKVEQTDLEKRLEEATSDLEKAKKKRSFFGRMFSSSKNSPLDLAKEKVDSLKSKQQEIEENLNRLETVSVDSGEQLENELAVLKEKLESLQQSQGEWNMKKDEKSKFTEKRIEATASLSRVISVMKLEEPSVEKPE
jgi:chromosome segregation ATPase